MLNLDFETYSQKDLPSVGAYHYAQHESTEALMLGWAIDEGDISVWDIKGGQKCPPELHRALFKDEHQISAFNAQFERLIFKYCLNWDIPADRFECSMVRAYSLGFKGGLDQALEQFNVGACKYPQGKVLMKIFSKPGKAQERTRALYEEYIGYCRMDVEVERKLVRKLSTYTTLTQGEYDNYVLDQKINDNGLPIDSKLVKSALSVAVTEKSILARKLKAMTKLDNPNSNQQFRGWLEEQNYALPDMQKATIDKALADLPDGAVKTALTWKQQLGKTSTSKWDAIDRSLCTDLRIHGAFQFMGASRTRRWAGRILQPQNLPRGTIKDPDTACDLIVQGHEMVSLLYPSVMDVLSSTIRGAIRALKGKMLVVSDLGSIESRTIGWLTGCKRINHLFATGQDTYKDLASQIFHVPYENVTKHQRFLAKPASLGGQYMLGGKGLQNYAENFGVALTAEEAQGHINTYRGMYPEIPAFWYWLKDAIEYVLTTGNDMKGYRLVLAKRGEFLFIKLPSGRNIPYYQPEIQDRPAPWDKSQMIKAFTYMGMDSYTKQWKRISAHPGGVTENIIQSLSRDVLAEWMMRIDKAGYRIVGHVHDEVILECDKNFDAVLTHVNQMIAAPLDWAPGLILTAEGFVSERYKKD